jgi:hypothetical protein
MASMTTYQNKAIKKVRSSKARSIPHLQIINVVAFQLKFIGSMKIILCFMFLYCNFTMHLPIREEFIIPFHLLKSMVNKYEVDDIVDSRIYNREI